MDIDSPGSTSAPTIHILIVEDEYVIAANLQENLEALGYHVLDIACSASEAVEKAAALRPDLVLMDIRLQGERDGIQAAEQIWGRLQIPVIYVTGHSDKSTVERAKVTFPFGYILKPVKGKELYVAIETALNRHEREQLLATVLRSMGDGMIVVNTQGRVLFLNRSAELLTGWQQEDARDRDLTEVFNVVNEETHRPLGNLATAAIQQDTILFLTERALLNTKEGTTLPITDSIAPIKTQKGLITGAVLLFRDDTQRRLQEEQALALERTLVLQRQNEELERLSQLKDDFLSSVSHELRSPLANIKMAIRMLEATLDEQGRLDAETHPNPNSLTRYMNILRDQCNQELNLVNDLLELQQLEAGTHLLEWDAVDLNTWIGQEIAVFREQARHREQQLQVLVSPDLPILVSDLKILTRILTELLMNACKHTPPHGTITVSAEVEGTLERESTRADMIQIRVCNTGIEIAAHELTRIFDKFYRIPTSDRWQQGGIGLGLALVKKAVTYLGGSIRAESSAEQTCFILELPLFPPDETESTGLSHT